MLSEKEYDLLKIIAESPYLKREGFSSDSEFDSVCERALELHSAEVVKSTSSKPYRRNMQGSGQRFTILGPFHLSTIAEEALQFENYAAYAKENSPPGEWTLANKIAAASLLVAIVGVVVVFL